MNWDSVARILLLKGLDKLAGKAKNIAKFRHLTRPPRRAVSTRVYDFNPAVAIPEKRSKMSECKHPRVQIVAREEDEEFVECLECGEIFESSEFKDMAIEETKLPNDS